MTVQVSSDDIGATIAQIEGQFALFTQKFESSMSALTDKMNSRFDSLAERVTLKMDTLNEHIKFGDEQNKQSIALLQGEVNMMKNEIKENEKQTLKQWKEIDKWKNRVWGVAIGVSLAAGGSGFAIARIIFT